MRIFVSYAHVDWQFVDKLANRLRRYHDVWFDERLHAGQAWWQAILERINWSECFIYVLSPESLASQYCRDEYDEARNLEKHIVPIRLQPNIELPDTLQRIQYADFSTRKFEDALTDLVGDLGRLELQARVQETVQPAPQRQSAISSPSPEQLDHFEAFREAVEARQADDHETALRLFNTLVQAAPDFLPEQVADLIQHSEAELERQARRKEYDRLYKQVSLLALDPLTLEGAREMWEGLLNDFPEIDDDPEELASVFQRIAQTEEEARLEAHRRQQEETERAQRKAEEKRVQLEADASRVSEVASAQGVASGPMPATQPTIREINPLWIIAGVIGAGLLVGILALTGVLGGGREPATSTLPTGLPTELPMAEDAGASPTVTSPPEPTATLSPYELAEQGVDTNNEWEPYTEDVNGVEMALVPAGCFQMGSENGYADETPVHQQCFDEPFWIDVYEVTNAQYGSEGEFSGDNRPRETVSWFDATAHCESRGARLPTEAEWEYAARGPDNLTYPWGNDFEGDYVIWHTPETADVGSKPEGASWVGALDMSGNVLEWMSSIYGAYPYRATDGREVGGSIDSSSSRVLRGSSWRDFYANSLRAAGRVTRGPNYTFNYGGFRCARSF